jgi:hypothetical protein
MYNRGRLQTKIKMEDNLKKNKMEDDLQTKKWKKTSKEKGRQSQKMEDNLKK